MLDIESREAGLSHIYLDENMLKFSNVALGVMIRALGYNLNVAYINTKKNIFSIIFLFTRYKFENLDFYDFDSFEIEHFQNYDLIIFDNCSFSNISKEKLLDVLKKKAPKTEILFTMKDKANIEEVKDEFDLISCFRYRMNENGKMNIVSVFGNGKGKTTYCIGAFVRNVLEKKKTKIIQFDKGGNFYGDTNFLKILKRTNFELIDVFNYGTNRLQNGEFRLTNTKEDVDEAKRALKELERTQERELVIADELNTTVKTHLLEEEEILKVLSRMTNRCIISGRNPTTNMLDISGLQIEVVEKKHYYSKGYGIRKGIDY